MILYVREIVRACKRINVRGVCKRMDQKEFGRLVGSRLKSARLDAKLTQKQIGELLGLDGATAQVRIARLESGNTYEIDFYVIVTVAKATCKSLYFFIGADI